jgi:chromosomal replication initiator protein
LDNFFLGDIITALLNMINEQLWQIVLAQIQLEITPANFTTWFKNTQILSQEDKIVIVSVPNSFAKEWLENKYNKTILKIIKKNDGGIKEVKYVVKKPVDNKSKVNPFSLDKDVGQLNFQNFNTNKETNLNPKYTFENFVIGPFNELAHAASLAIVDSLGSVYNPFFIYGGVGLGKTHLLQAIGNEIIKKDPTRRVKYTTTEKFTSSVVNAIRDRSMEELKETFRSFDLLILDDIQFLSGKEKTQEEFFHIFNYLHENNKQLILSSDRPPKSIQALAERLRSRFEGGMIIDISYPDYETRLAILKTKSKEKDCRFSEDVLDYIATNVQKNIRELEGCLNKLIAYHKLNNKVPTLELAKALLKNFVLSKNTHTSPGEIIKAVSCFYDIKEKDILSTSRKKEIVKPRQIAMYLMKEELNSSYPFIGRKMGGKDHTTAIYACDKISKAVQVDENLGGEIELIKQRILSA